MTPSPTSLWARLPGVAIDAETTAGAEEAEPPLFLHCAFLRWSLGAAVREAQRFFSASHLFPPLENRFQPSANKRFHFVSSLCC